MPTRDGTRPGPATGAGLWFPAPAAPGDCAVRLLCLPYAGGSPVMYRTWDEALADTADVLPVCLPGRAHRWGEPLRHDLHRIADDVAEAAAPLQRDLPLALFGYSLGALLAFEVARRLTRRGRPPLLLVVAACAPPRSREALSPKHTLPDEEFIAVLRQMGATPQAILDDEEMLSLLLPMLRSDFALADRYRRTPGPALSVPVVALAGRDDPEAGPEVMSGWARETHQPLRRLDLDGGHLFIEERRPEVVALVRSALRSAVAHQER
ncbi:thioesterase II family protein [Streptomyces genisteinicus]|uniref:Thioesterase n=1 Tax=Streptomyces genisteinicus TaxID=2768068 RepID=A0A7H0I1G3_9ACTN|nr:alpha/beta fold hydrolase [Streptomyces genisteinicus]QNP66629.1 thioesterase [Streptomyces genisteinicus]